MGETTHSKRERERERWVAVFSVLADVQPRIGIMTDLSQRAEHGSG